MRQPNSRDNNFHFSSPLSGTMFSHVCAVGSAAKRRHPRLFILSRFAARWLLLGVCAFMLALLVCASATPLARAQTPPELVVIADQTPIIIEAPKPFVEVSRILPEAFAQRARALAQANGNRLLAWFIPALSLNSQLNEKPNDPAPRSRVLQVQVTKELEPVRYNAKSFQALRNDNTRGFAAIGENDVDTLFAMLDLRQLAQKSGGQKILGASELGPDSFTLCIAISAEGSDQLGGREVETSVTCVTYMLIKEKVILLTVTGPELTTKELHNAMRLTREWLTILRERNPVGK